MTPNPALLAVCAVAALEAAALVAAWLCVRKLVEQQDALLDRLSSVDYDALRSAREARQLAAHDAARRKPPARVSERQAALAVPHPTLGGDF